ncbi:hypothetical protein AA313_de0210279 [Arthrobotrys entomopaga]|nr:hypothetical protein AA313_de0210279 [Arthrobotrys entomopaga]
MVHLDLATLRNSTEIEVIEYLKRMRAEHQDAEITQQIISVLESGAIDSHIFQIWMGVAPTDEVLLQALEQNISVRIRQDAIQKLRKYFSGPAWANSWQAIGGTPGMLRILARLSVDHVSMLCHNIGRSAKETDPAEKRKAYTELLKSLLRFPDSHENPDKRPLTKYYRYILPGCTEELVANVLNQLPGCDWNDMPKWLFRRLLQCYLDTMREFVLRKWTENPHAPPSRIEPFVTYPSTKASLDIPRLSSSTESALGLLRTLVREGKYVNDEIITKVLTALFRRALKKEVKLPQVQKIVDLSKVYFDRQPSSIEKMGASDSTPTELLTLITAFWSRRPEVFEGLLSAFFSRCEPKFLDLIPHVRMVLRYRFLKLWLKTRDLDIDDLKKLKDIVHYSFLWELPPTDASDLFNRVFKKMNTQKDYASSVHQNMFTSDLFAVTGDLGLVEIEVLQRLERQREATDLAIERINSWKQKATVGASNEERAFCAQITFRYAVASRSFAVFHDIISWSRRFVRDSLAFFRLYGGHYLAETSKLLSINGAVDASTARGAIADANKVLESIFEIVCLALKEPSFQRAACLAMFEVAVRERMADSCALKKLDISDEEIYDILWKDLVDLIIKVENVGLEPGSQKLKLNTALGLLGKLSPVTLSFTKEQPSTYRFFDQLAKARDELWQAYRLKARPAISNLPSVFPRGLPIQYLATPYLLSMDTPEAEEFAPYIASRAKNILFLPSEQALTLKPNDKSLLTAIGGFIDSYAVAFSIMMPDTLEDNMKRERLEKVLDHATGPLVHGRMNKAQALCYWGEFFSRNTHISRWPYIMISGARDDTKIKLDSDWLKMCPRKSKWRMVPPPTDTSKPWNPFPEAQQETVETVEPLELDNITYLELSVVTAINYRGLTILSETPSTTISLPKSKSRSWSESSFQDIEIITDGTKAQPSSLINKYLTLIAYLYVESHIPGLNLLPFPSERDVKYPRVVLEESFLEDLKRTSTWGWTANLLQEYLKYIPPILMARVAEVALKTIDNSALISRSQKRFWYLRQLQACDQPQLASKIVLRAILENPDASSWHRTLACPWFLHSLSSWDALDFITTFANEVIRISEQQAQNKESGNDNNSKKSYVKVTTVKYLAQLLCNAEYIPLDSSISILSALFQKTTHVDIKGAVADSFLEMLLDGTPEVSNVVLSALRESVVSIAGNIDERKIFTGEDWQRAAETSILPGISVPLWSCPMLKMILDFQTRDFPCKAQFAEEIVMPILESLKVETERYFTIFLKKQGLDDAALKDLKIPRLPKSIETWATAIHGLAGYAPVSIAEEFIDFGIFILTMPEPVKQVIQKVRARIDDSPPAQADELFWLEAYGKGSIIANSTGFQLSQLFDLEEKWQRPGLAGELFLKLYDAVLSTDSPVYTWHQALVHQLDYRNDEQEKWYRDYRPILQSIVSNIDGLRTPDWEKNPNRKPQVLPDTFFHRCMLLEFPRVYKPGNENKIEELCERFSEEVVKLVGEIIQGDNLRRLDQLQTVVKNLREDEALFVAVQIGELAVLHGGSWPRFQEQACIDLVKDLFNHGKRDRQRPLILKPRFEQMVGSFKINRSEDIRRVGFELEDVWT